MARNKINKDWSYSDEFDRLMQSHFGENFKTGWNLFAGSCGGYVTVRSNGKEMTPTMRKIGRLISDSIATGQEAYE